MKAISTVIATVLMLTMTIAIAGTSWMFISGVFTSKTSTAFSLVDSYGDTVTIRNDGTEPITGISAKLDGSNVNIAIVPNIGGLVAYWSMNEGGGCTANDNTGNGNDGNLMPNCPTNSPLWVDGKYGKALQFSGNEYVVKNPFNNFPITGITVSFWMKSSDTVDGGTPFSYASTAHDNDFLIHRYSNFKIERGTIDVITNQNANDGSWHHIAVTWSSSGETKFYKDTVVWSGTLASGTSITPGGSLVIAQEQDSIGGDFDPAQAFIGIIDELSIYNRVLSADEIKQLYESLVAPGQLASIKPLPSTPLSKGTHTLRLCTSSMCSTSYLTIQ